MMCAFTTILPKARTKIKGFGLGKKILFELRICLTRLAMALYPITSIRQWAKIALKSLIFCLGGCRRWGDAMVSAG
jgi:hypothetical protein